MNEKLLQLGLTPNESKIYELLTQVQELTVAQLAKKTKIHRTTVYEFLNKLESKNLVSHVIKSNVQTYFLNSEDKLLDYIDEKKDIAQEVIAEISQRRKSNMDEPIVETHTGKDGIKFLLNDILRTRKDYVCFGINEKEWDEQFSLETQRHMPKEKALKIKWRALIGEDQSVGYEPGNYRVIEKEYFVNNPMVVYGSNTAQIIWNPLTIIIIRNEELSIIHKKHFELIWKTAKSKRLSKRI